MLAEGMAEVKPKNETKRIFFVFRWIALLRRINTHIMINTPFDIAEEKITLGPDVRGTYAFQVDAAPVLLAIRPMSADPYTPPIEFGLRASVVDAATGQAMSANPTFDFVNLHYTMTTFFYVRTEEMAPPAEGAIDVVVGRAYPLILTVQNLTMSEALFAIKQL